MSELRGYPCPDCGVWVDSRHHHVCADKEALYNGCAKVLGVGFVLIVFLLISGSYFWPGKPFPTAPSTTRPENWSQVESFGAYIQRQTPKWLIFAVAWMAISLAASVLSVMSIMRISQLSAKDLWGEASPFSIVLAVLLFLIHVPGLIGAVVWWHYHMFVSR